MKTRDTKQLGYSPYRKERERKEMDPTEILMLGLLGGLILAYIIADNFL